MGFKNLTKYAVISIVGSIFLLMASSSLVRAKDYQPYPLFEESLQETLQEFNKGTKRIRQKSGKVLSRESVAADKSPLIGSRDISDDFLTYLEDVKKANFIPLILFGLAVKNTINGPVQGATGNESVGTVTDNIVIYNGPLIKIEFFFPTFLGTTCATTCGVRSTCTSGLFCQIFPSQSAKLNSPDRLDHGSEKPVNFTPRFADLDNPDRLAQGNEKPVNFTIF